MGIKDLYTFLKRKKVPIEECSSSFFANSTIAVDAYSLFFRLFYTGKKISLTSHQSATISLLEAFLGRWKKTTTLIFIFDCPTKGKLKMDTIQKRRDEEASLQERIKEIEKSSQSSPFNPRLIERKEALQRRSKENFPQVCKEMRYLLNDRGYKTIIAPDEAERLACDMAINGKADYVYSNDSDCLALSCPVVIFDESGGLLKMYRHSTILRCLGLTSEQFRDFCILLGTDYNDRMKSPEDAYTSIKTYGSLEEIPGLEEKIFDNLEEIQQQLTIVKTTV